MSRMRLLICASCARVIASVAVEAPVPAVPKRPPIAAIEARRAVTVLYAAIKPTRALVQSITSSLFVARYFAMEARPEVRGGIICSMRGARAAPVAVPKVEACILRTSISFLVRSISSGSSPTLCTFAAF